MRRNFCLAAMLALLVVVRVSANDAYYQVPFSELKITEGSLPIYTNESRWTFRASGEYLFPAATVDRGEAFVSAGAEGNGQPRNLGRPDMLCVRAPIGADVSGQMFLPKPDDSGMVRVKFVVPAGKAKSDARVAFYRA